MATENEQKQKINIEQMRGKVSEEETKVISKTYEDYYKFKAQRDGSTDQFQGKQLEDFLTTSREMFWNSVVTPSNDLSALNLSLTIGFIRKEVWDFCSQLTSQDFKAKIDGENLDIFGVKVLQAIYDKWRFKSNDKVEKFWQILYGVVNGTVCEYIGYNNAKIKHRYLKEYDKKAGAYKIEEKEDYYYNDVWTEIAPLEDIYLAKTWERDIQRQGKMIWRNQMKWSDFKRDFYTFDNAEYVYPGNQIAEDSLYFRLLKGSGVTSYDMVEVMKEYDVVEDEYTIVANGVWLNPVGEGDKQQRAPMPFNHKLMPFGWTIWKAIDEKFAYGMSSPFELKDYQKILNTSMCVTPETKILTRDLRWVEAGSLKVGDKLFAFEEYGKVGKKEKGRDTLHRAQRHFEEATVTGTGRKTTPVLQVNLEDGTKLKCTPNHRWLIWNHEGGGANWMRTDEMMKHLKLRGTNKKHQIFSMPKYLNVYEQKKTYEAGYLAGLFDGEGSFSKGNSGKNGKPSRGMQISFAQQNNSCFEKGLEILKSEGYDINIHTHYYKDNKFEPVCHAFLRGGLNEIMRLLTETRPVRLITEGWHKKDISEMLMKKLSLIEIESIEDIAEQEIVTLESSSKTYFAEGFGAHNTMLVEEELRAIDPPILSSDFESPELIYGQHKVIPVNDVNAYKTMDTKEGSQSFYQMINSLSGLMTAQAQGGIQQVAPSRQPKSSREVLQMQMLKQQALGNSLLMYYNMLRQEMLLVLKTALQFYPTNKYVDVNNRIVRAIKIPNTSLIGGGVGTLQVRLVKSKQDDLITFFEAIEESIKNGKVTEIIEAPIDVIRELEFIIHEIKISPAQTSELERATWVEQVFTPLLNNFVQPGLVDPAKLYLRLLEKMGEHPADFTSDKVMPNIMSAWGNEMKFEMPDPNAPKKEAGAQTSNLIQSGTGIQNGGNNQGGAKTLLPA